MKKILTKKQLNFTIVPGEPTVEEKINTKVMYKVFLYKSPDPKYSIKKINVQ